MAPKFLKKSDTKTIVNQARDVFARLIGEGTEDSRRLASKVIHESDKCEVRRYQTTASSKPGAVGGASPVLLVPPVGSSSASFDIGPGHSLAEYLLNAGHAVYVCDYGVSGKKKKDLGLDFWATKALPKAIKAVSKDNNGEKVAVVGWSLGGVMAMFTAAADPQLPIASVATIASPFDFSRVAELDRVRLQEIANDGTLSSLIRVLGVVPEKLNSIAFSWMPNAGLGGPNLVDESAQIEAIDAMIDRIEASPGRTFAQMYHAFISANKFNESGVKVGKGKRISLSSVQAPVMHVFGESDLIFAPKQKWQKLADLLPNAAEVRLEIAPGGHLGVLAGVESTNVSWRVLTSFLAAPGATTAAGRTSPAKTKKVAGEAKSKTKAASDKPTKKRGTTAKPVVGEAKSAATNGKPLSVKKSVSTPKQATAAKKAPTTAGSKKPSAKSAATVTGKPTKSPPANASSSQATAMSDAKAPAKSTSTKATANKVSANKVTPVKDAPAKATPAKTAPAKTAAKSTPAKTTPAKTAAKVPSVGAPVPREAAPTMTVAAAPAAESVSANPPTAKANPAKTTPAVATNKAPAAKASAPAKTTPAKTAAEPPVAKAIPAKTTPTENAVKAPVVTAPAATKVTPAEATPTNETRPASGPSGD